MSGTGAEYAKEMARVADGRPRPKSLAPLRGIMPFLAPYRGRIAVACLALIASSTATLILPPFAGGLVGARGLSATQAPTLGSL